GGKRPTPPPSPEKRRPLSRAQGIAVVTDLLSKGKEPHLIKAALKQHYGASPKSTDAWIKASRERKQRDLEDALPFMLSELIASAREGAREARASKSWVAAARFDSLTAGMLGLLRPKERPAPEKKAVTISPEEASRELEALIGYAERERARERGTVVTV